LQNYRTFCSSWYPVHMIRKANINGMEIGSDAPLLIIAGPCVLESEAQAMEIASELHSICQSIGLNLVFKGSFDKANRTSVFSDRGLGIYEGIQILSNIKEKFNIPVTTDIHVAEQAVIAAEVVDILQIPAFLCRQTDLLVAAASTEAMVNVKKGQFLSPQEMNHVITKLNDAKCTNMMLTERGTFFGYNRLVNDFIGIADLLEMGPPICFDVTHSTQLPGAGNGFSGGRPEHAPLLARSATAAGVDALFLECHPNPPKAACDADTVQPLSKMSEILTTCNSIRESMKLQSSHRVK